MSERNYNSIQQTHEHDLLYYKRELFLYNRSDDGIDQNTAITFLKNFRLLLAFQQAPITVHQYSVGGDVEAGMAIFDAIKTCPVHVTIICYGIAASIGSVIPQAADSRICTPNCVWMVHDGTLGSPDEYRSGQSWTEYRKVERHNMMDIYAEAILGSNSPFFKGKTQKQIIAYIDKKIKDKGDWIMTAKEAVDYGFCDSLLSGV